MLTFNCKCGLRPQTSQYHILSVENDGSWQDFPFDFTQRDLLFQDVWREHILTFKNRVNYI